jgi:hypothetical protein
LESTSVNLDLTGALWLHLVKHVEVLQIQTEPLSSKIDVDAHQTMFGTCLLKPAIPALQIALQLIMKDIVP